MKEQHERASRSGMRAELMGGHRGRVEEAPATFIRAPQSGSKAIVPPTEKSGKQARSSRRRSRPRSSGASSSHRGGPHRSRSRSPVRSFSHRRTSPRSRSRSPVRFVSPLWNSRRSRSRSPVSSSSHRRISRRSISRDDEDSRSGHRELGATQTRRRQSLDASNQRHHHEDPPLPRKIQPILHPAWKLMIPTQRLRKPASWDVAYYARLGRFVEALGFDSGLPSFTPEEVVVLSREPDQNSFPPIDPFGLSAKGAWRLLLHS